MRKAGCQYRQTDSPPRVTHPRDYVVVPCRRALNEFIGAAIAADGDDAKLHAAEVTFDKKIQETIDEPFATAKSMGFPARWTAKNLAATTSGWARIQIWSLDGLKFDKKNGAFEFIGLKKLTNVQCYLP